MHTTNGKHQVKWDVPCQRIREWAVDKLNNISDLKREHFASPADRCIAQLVHSYDGGNSGDVSTFSCLTCQSNRATIKSIKWCRRPFIGQRAQSSNKIWMSDATAGPKRQWWFERLCRRATFLAPFPVLISVIELLDKWRHSFVWMRRFVIIFAFLHSYCTVFQLAMNCLPWEAQDETVLVSADLALKMASATKWSYKSKQLSKQWDAPDHGTRMGHSQRSENVSSLRRDTRY